MFIKTRSINLVGDLLKRFPFHALWRHLWWKAIGVSITNWWSQNTWRKGRWLWQKNTIRHFRLCWHPWDHSWVMDTDCVPRFKSCAGNAAHHPVRNINKYCKCKGFHQWSHHCVNSFRDSDFTFIYRKIFKITTLTHSPSTHSHSLHNDLSSRGPT